MRLVDTSAWIELLAETASTPALERQLPPPGDWLLPTIVLLELKKWMNRELPENKASNVLSFTETCVVADLDTTTALMAADICRQHKLATADAIIYASVLIHNAELLTCDRHFEGLDHVIYVAKQKSP